MTKLSVLQELSFGQRVAEEEGDSLASYFVETDHWRRLYSGQVDVIYGPKGAGKSALYFLLMARTDELFDRSIILTPAENPRGAPAFKDLVTNPPASEREFVALWKLFFLSLISATLTEVGIDDADAMRLHHALAAEGLVRGPQTLARLLRSVVDYVRAAFRLESMEAGLTVDPITGVPAGFTGKISFHEPDAKAARGGVISIDELFALADTALGGADYSLWLLIDRLDVAFAESSELEQNALRALFGSTSTYWHFRGLP